MPRPGVSPSAGGPVNQASVSVSISVSVAGPIGRTRDRGAVAVVHAWWQGQAMIPQTPEALLGPSVAGSMSAYGT